MVPRSDAFADGAERLVSQSCCALVAFRLFSPTAHTVISLFERHLGVPVMVDFDAVLPLP